MLRYEIRYINFVYGTITTDSWDTLEETKARLEEIEHEEINLGIDVDVIEVFDNELEDYIEVK